MYKKLKRERVVRLVLYYMIEMCRQMESRQSDGERTNKTNANLNGVARRHLCHDHRHDDCFDSTLPSFSVTPKALSVIASASTSAFQSLLLPCVPESLPI